MTGGDKARAEGADERRWPQHVEGQRYVADRFGVVWLLVPQYDGGMATTADAVAQWSVGINPLRNERGPLVPVFPSPSPQQPDGHDHTRESEDQR